MFSQLAWRALIIADVFKGALKGQFGVSKYKDPKIQREDEKKLKMAFREHTGLLLWCLASFNWARCPLQHKLPTPSLNTGQRTVDIPPKFKVIPEAFALLLWSLSELHFGSGRESQKFLSTCICPNSAGQTPASVPMNVFIQRTGHTSREITV